ncbi:MAG TPA: hypothetical protein VN922_16675 [Bacteroidia bacterium]|nr:hypothetical protein [Bacteroidia bacterium]
MGALCKLMITDFMIGDCSKMLGETTYDEYNLLSGIEYAKWLIEMEYTHEPHYKYDLFKFIEWAQNKLNRLNK